MRLRFIRRQLCHGCGSGEPAPCRGAGRRVICTRRLPGLVDGEDARMFFFFSNNLGCFGSILVSLAGTLLLLLVLGVVRI
jgi:hypothetical protein